jgi:hypothetical protein
VNQFLRPRRSSGPFYVKSLYVYEGVTLRRTASAIEQRNQKPKASNKKAISIKTSVFMFTPFNYFAEILWIPRRFLILVLYLAVLLPDDPFRSHGQFIVVGNHDMVSPRA